MSTCVKALPAVPLVWTDPEKTSIAWQVKSTPAMSVGQLALVQIFDTFILSYYPDFLVTINQFKNISNIASF